MLWGHGKEQHKSLDIDDTGGPSQIPRHKSLNTLFFNWKHGSYYPTLVPPDLLAIVSILIHTSTGLLVTALVQVTGLLTFGRV